jgi:hypothetical protein
MNMEVHMPELSSLFQVHEARPVLAGDQIVTVISKALRLQVPGMPIGLVWNRPYAVRVQTAGAGEVTLPVVDETRRLQILLLGLGIAGSILISTLLRRR